MPSLKNTALTFLEIFSIECCTVLVKPPKTSSLYSQNRRDNRKNPEYHVVVLSDPICCSFFDMVWPWFFCGTVCVCPQFSYILDFSYCPLSRVLHVTLANWQEFGFEFHLRSSPSYSEYMDISQPVDYFI